MVGFCQVRRFVILESAKDQILGVDAQDNMCHHMSDLEWLVD
jgi:hypothetical protein